MYALFSMHIAYVECWCTFIFINSKSRNQFVLDFRFSSCQQSATEITNGTEIWYFFSDSDMKKTSTIIKEESKKKKKKIRRKWNIWLTEPFSHIKTICVQYAVAFFCIDDDMLWVSCQEFICLTLNCFHFCFVVAFRRLEYL